MNCPGCGSHVSEEKRFCDECGTALPIVCSVCSGTNRAEAKFCGDCGSPLTTHLSAPARGQSRTPLSAPGRPVPEAERRHLTVMFCDLVGSTALSARLDPEDMRELIRAYQECCTEVVARFDGNVAKYMGDGILVYFGYPRAHEDAAERAIRASLAITEAVGMLKSHVQLQVRVGIATGLVVVGDLIGHGAAQEQAVVGETPNLAARLQALAEPDTILIAEST
jgi:class 3 adenylate cyclase